MIDIKRIYTITEMEEGSLPFEEESLVYFGNSFQEIESQVEAAAPTTVYNGTFEKVLCYLVEEHKHTHSDKPKIEYSDVKWSELLEWVCKGGRLILTERIVNDKVIARVMSNVTSVELLNDDFVYSYIQEETEEGIVGHRLLVRNIYSGDTEWYPLTKEYINNN